MSPASGSLSAMESQLVGPKGPSRESFTHGGLVQTARWKDDEAVTPRSSVTWTRSHRSRSQVEPDLPSDPPLTLLPRV